MTQAYTGTQFYDDDAIFDVYMQHRHRKEDSPNDVLEKPVILDLAGDLTNKRILDLGCGDAAFGVEALQAGCQNYFGIDGSQNMIASAQKVLSETDGSAELGDIATWDYPAAAFDLVVARLSLHYIEDIQAVFNNVFRALDGNGKFVFSIEHPVITSCARGWSGNAPRQDWVVDDYFSTGQRVTQWIGGTVIKYHRTIEQYFANLGNAGLIVDSLREAHPVRENFASEASFQRRKRIPLFLIMSSYKPRGN